MSINVAEEQVGKVNQIDEPEIFTPTMRRLAQSRFVLMIIGSITIALILVMASMAMYTSSGTAQLDLSRPGYQSVRDQIKPDDRFDGFSTSGPIDDKTLKSFKKMYDERTKAATSVNNAFNSEVLSDQALGIDDVPADAAN